MQPCGDCCLVIEFDQSDIERANDTACHIAHTLLSAGLAGVTDIVPSMAAVGVHYDPAAFVSTDDGQAPWDVLSAKLEALLAGLGAQQNLEAREQVIPVCYGGEFGEDLDAVARTCGISREEVIRLHSQSEARVFMLGFAPGHPYIGLFDARLAIGRRPTPRTAVPEGSIGLANRQSVIYPMTLPGGWSLIGRTPLKLFDPYSASPCLLNAGDRIRFEPISPSRFYELEQQQREKG